MNFQEVYEVIIGLILILLALSTVTMVLQEYMTNIFLWLTNNLKIITKKLLKDENLTKYFYDRPLIRNLSGERAAKKAGFFLTGLSPTKKSSFRCDMLVTFVNVRASGIKPA